MFVYDALNHQQHAGALGILAPAFGKLVDGVQTLDPAVAANVMTFLQGRYAIPDPKTPSAGAGVTNYIAVTPEKFVGFGYQLEGVPTAAQQVAALPVTRATLANTEDVATVMQGQPLASGDFRFAVADLAAVKYIAGPTSSLAVLPRAGAPGVAAGEAKKKELSPVVIPLIGAGIGLVVAGPVGAAVGAGIGIGVEIIREQQAKKAA